MCITRHSRSFRSCGVGPFWQKCGMATFQAFGRSSSLRLGLGCGTIQVLILVVLLAAVSPREAFKGSRLPLRCRGLFVFLGSGF